jgi:hypothetical protein
VFWSVGAKGQRHLVRAECDRQIEAYLGTLPEAAREQLCVARAVIAFELREHDRDALVSVEASGSVDAFRRADGRTVTERGCSVKVAQMQGVLADLVPEGG